MSTSKNLKWVTGILEGVLGIPILGGLLVVSFVYIPLAVMLILHIVTLVFSVKEGKDKYGSILGIATSCLAVIPFLGMLLHMTSAVLLMMNAAKKDDLDETVYTAQ